MTGAAASAADATEVSVRVEGASNTLLETTIDTSVHAVDGGDGTGKHVCRGPIGETAGSTVTGALDDALKEAGKSWRGEWSDSSGDFLVTSVAGEAATTSGPWTILLNGIPTPVGGCSMKVAEGDRVLFARDVVFQTKTLGLSGPAEVEPGQQFRLFVDDERDGGSPVAGAEVTSGELNASSDASGEALFTIDEAGRYAFKASHPDGIRSNSIEVCVGVGGCAGNPTETIRITGITDGTAFMRGATPRRIRGTSPRDATFRLAVKFRGYAGRCRAWNGPAARLVYRSCKAKLNWFAATAEGRDWSLRVGKLPPGRYRILARPSGSDGKPWRHGVNRIDFRVLSRRFALRSLLKRSLRYLDRETRGADVRSSGLLSGWAGLALGVRERRSANRLAAVLRLARPGRASSGDLARNLAALIRVPRGRSVAAMRKELVSRQAADGSFDGDVNLTAMAVLALPGSYPETRAAVWLADQQQDDGGFSASGSGASDVDTTGLVTWALATSGFSDGIWPAAEFVRSAQNPDGGFPAMPGAISNAQSTGLGLLAIHLAGGSRLGPKTADGITPAHFLATLQAPSGSIGYTRSLRTTPVWVTSQALLGLTTAKRLVRAP